MSAAANLMEHFFKKCIYCKQKELKTIHDRVKGNWLECSVCGRVVEERQPKLKHTTISSYRWSPFEMPDNCSSSVADSTSLSSGSIDNGFTISYSMMRSELYSADLAFSRSIAGDIIELQKLIGEDLLNGSAKKNTSDSDTVMIGYVTIDELCTIFGTPLQKIRTVRLFQRCLKSAIRSNVKDVETLAVAAYAVITCKDYEEIALKIDVEVSLSPDDQDAPKGHTGSIQRDDTILLRKDTTNNLQNSSNLHVPFETNSNITFKDIVAESQKRCSQTKRNLLTEKLICQYIEMISNMLNNEPYVVPALQESMSKYFKALDLKKETASIAAYIGNQAVKKHLCSRRNNSSLSAASVYLACQLQGMRTTQNSFCKTVGLTEVTLRKVYKELKNHWQTLVPENYKPYKVPSGLKSSAVRSRQQNRASGGAPVVSQRGGRNDLPSAISTTPIDSRPSVVPNPARSSEPRTFFAGGLDRSTCERVPNLEQFAVPKQYTSNGVDLWANDAKCGAPYLLLQEYPRPSRVLADVPSTIIGASSDVRYIPWLHNVPGKVKELVPPMEAVEPDAALIQK
eukprot:CAMPEP_0114487058 /NCGR_PEP_ID=MMETSP0109-20121206/557_1 /TAXON_ID=29199 /ORGANISM="Chlorarachnion reptans, Strain CCCM449" /LENGTH=567 /DNA_ID=CAMNT_0001663285 /DNA_START=266 /DNA_END=1969 /DNA_ORIENTATION=+